MIEQKPIEFFRYQQNIMSYSVAKNQLNFKTGLPLIFMYELCW